ncbi:nectin-1-like isoform X2 [Latimeria chalumnae]|uniref:nectin-1-like isoform X2 n=1 Tax=Latimeria chalumnae TaxID=7897 RepID=UPI00313C4E6C
MEEEELQEKRRRRGSSLLLLGMLLLAASLGWAKDTVDVNGDVYANLGEDVLLKCRLETEDQTVQLTWQKQRLPQNENFLTQTPGSPPKYLNDFAKRVKLVGDGNTNGSIIITDVTLFDEDTYICIFTVFPGGPVEKTISLKIRAPPAVSIEPSPDPPEIGSAETLIATCIAAIGRPGAKVIWQTRPFTCSVKESRSTYHNGTETVQSKLLMVPRREIHGQEVNCTVEHPSFMSPAKVPYRISVYYPPSVQIVSLKTGETTLDLICKADANPPAKDFTWKKDDGMLPEGTIMKEMDRLHLTSQNADLSGLYVCEAANSLGNHSGSLYLEFFSLVVIIFWRLWRWKHGTPADQRI